MGERQRKKRNNERDENGRKVEENKRNNEGVRENWRNKK